MKPDQAKEQAFQTATETFNDPNCTINISSQGPIINYHAPSQQNIQDATDAILKLAFADIWQMPPFGINVGTVRLEVEGAIAGGGRNWQVQINGINPPSTISAVLVQGNLATASTDERRMYVQRMVRVALVQSLNIAMQRNVNGPCK
jgi:hypothetical protein